MVEVMVSILILSIAIIPMVGMFDAGLRAASTTGNYDTARAFANKKLETARDLAYDDVRNGFPNGSSGTPGTSATIDKTTEPGVPDGFSYTVTKSYKCLSAPASLSCAPPTGSTSVLADSGTTDRGFVEIRVRVSWDSGSGASYSTTGIIARGTP